MITEILKKLVERKNLTDSEASFAFEKIMSAELPEAQTASFLTAMQMKGASNNEIVAALKTIKAKSVRMNADIKDIVDTCGTGGDNSNTFNISTAAAFVASGAGVNIAKHGNRSVSSKCGSADILEELGVRIDIEPKKAEKILEKIGIVFLFAPIYHPSFKNISKVRNELGFKTIFNFLGPLSSPANAKRQVIGVYDPKLTIDVAKILKKLGHEHVLCVHGNGLDELTIAGRTKISELKEGKITGYFLDPKDFGFHGKLEDIKGGDKEKNKKIILEILGGKKGPKRDVVVLNAAAAIYVSGKAGSIKEGIDIANESIDSGKAKRKAKSADKGDEQMIKTDSYLDEIIKYKIKELNFKKKENPLEKIKSDLRKTNFRKREFAKAIKKKSLSLIAEIKKASPSKGVIKEDFDHLKIARSYEEGGADAISILTDEHFFMGDIRFIKEIKKIVGLPILRKDFIFDEYQLYESKLFGADALLLITGLLDVKELKNLLKIAESLHLDCLVETNSYHDIEKAVEAGAKIIGVNNRNLKNFKIDLTNFLNLSRFIPKDRIVVCESGIFSKEDVQKTRLAGADCILVGTALMQSANIRGKIQELLS